METFSGNIQINHYDAEGLHHEMEENGKLVTFIYRGDEAIAEESQEDKIRYIRTSVLLASDAESARTYYHYASDEMSSITHVVGENEEILNHYEYDAWGNLTVCEEKVQNRFKFNGQQYDPISQQYYLRARYYNPVIGRFTQEDSYNADGLNLYAYYRNNPVSYVDPSGNKYCRKAINRIMDAMNNGNADGEEISKLKDQINNKLDNGKRLNSAERRAAEQLGIDCNRRNENIFNTPLTLQQALEQLEASGLRPGQTSIYMSQLRNALNGIQNNYDPTRAYSSVYFDGTNRYLVEGHHTTVAFAMLGRESGLNMNIRSSDPPSATNVYWTKKWYEFWKRTIRIVED